MTIALDVALKYVCIYILSDYYHYNLNSHMYDIYHVYASDTIVCCLAPSYWFDILRLRGSVTAFIYIVLFFNFKVLDWFETD